jgi:hypothetical protein
MVVTFRRLKVEFEVKGILFLLASGPWLAIFEM